MEYKKIKDFDLNERVDSFFIIKELDVRTASNGKKFADLTLSDDSGDINAKIWDFNEEKNDLNENTIVKIRGDVSEWQGKHQLKIIRIRNINDDDDVNINDFVQSAPLESEDMYETILKYIDDMENEDIKKLTQYMIEENKEKLLYYPAAKSNHHSIKGGLLYHIVRMLYTGESLAKIYDYINKDLLYAGIILHDMAKLDEMNSNELGIVSEYTDEGQLLGHLIQGIKNISRASEKLEIDSEVSLLIEHMILSHHYNPEWGSPKKPMIPEGELLHYIDNIDAKMYDMEKELKELEDNEFTASIWTLDRRRLYKSSL